MIYRSPRRFPVRKLKPCRKDDPNPPLALAGPGFACASRSRPYVAETPSTASTRVETRSAVKENPKGRQNSVPHSNCAIRLVAVHPDRRISPCSTRARTAEAYAQSSSSGKSPMGSTASSANIQTARSSKTASTSEYLLLVMTLTNLDGRLLRPIDTTRSVSIVLTPKPDTSHMP